ncbi:MAG: nitroreductase family protein [bacterium]|nr:nitroreductase family protein [bacterium]
MKKQVFADLYPVISRRYSTRKFLPQDISSSIQVELMDEKHIFGLGSSSCEAALVHGKGRLDFLFKGVIGNYGKITGASAVIFLLISKDAGVNGLMEAGYVGEQYVLRATALGLGSCWVGGTYNKESVGELIDVPLHLKIAAIITIGWEERKTDRISSLLHIVIKRKALEKIADSNLLNGPEWLTKALEAVRKAPSAVNLQPWSFYGSPEKVSIKSVGFGTFAAMDLGIAMLHFEVAANFYGVLGSWKTENEAQYYYS